ncbi:MAG: hypothetical protein ACOX9R_14245 [Armatimonadota bacterium]|jgi:hypothetical protein
MEEKSSRRDSRIAIIIIIAGLLTGGVLTYAFLQPDEEPPRYAPEYRVVDGEDIPPELADAIATDQADPGEAEDARASGQSAEQPSAGAQPGSAPADDGGRMARDESTASERKTIEETRQRMRAQGVTEYVELTEELFIRVSARMVLMASILSQSTEKDADPAEVQSLLADNAADLLARERIDPEDFWSYTRDVHSDPERAMEIGEKILREAEKHTERKITFEDVPGMTPTPVPGAQ